MKIKKQGIIKFPKWLRKYIPSDWDGLGVEIINWRIRFTKKEGENASDSTE